MWVGIDLGGTNTKIALIDEAGKILESKTFPTRSFRTPQAWVKRAFLEIKGFPRIKGVGIGVPGAVDFDRGRIRYLPNLPGWENFPIVDKFSELLGRKIKIAVDNDATAMAIAEWVYGSAKGYTNAMCITLGTGVGAGLILDGKVYRGVDGVAGELGHFPLVPWGKACSCGGKGCLERYVGNRALVHWARKLGLLSTREDDLSIISARAKKGDKKAVDFWDKVAYTLAPTLIGVVNLLNLEVIVVGGGIASAGRPLIGSISKYVKAYTMKVQGRRVKIVKAKLGNSAGVIGASLLPRR